MRLRWIKKSSCIIWVHPEAHDKCTTDVKKIRVHMLMEAESEVMTSEVQGVVGTRS